MTSIRSRGARVVGVAVALCGLALVTTGASAETTRENARVGGTLIVALAEDPDALDPTLARTFVGRMVFLHICEKLYDLNSRLEIVPQLAAALPGDLGRQADGHDPASPRASASTTARR